MFVDLDGNQLFYSLTEIVGFNGIVKTPNSTWLTFNSATRNLSGLAQAKGNYFYRLTVDDGYGYLIFYIIIYYQQITLLLD